MPADEAVTYLLVGGQDHGTLLALPRPTRAYDYVVQRPRYRHEVEAGVPPSACFQTCRRYETEVGLLLGLPSPVMHRPVLRDESVPAPETNPSAFLCWYADALYKLAVESRPRMEVRMCLRCRGRDEYPVDSPLSQPCTTCERVALHKRLP